MVDFLIERTIQGEVGKRGGESIYCAIKGFAKSEVGERGREGGYRVVEGGAEGKVGERGGERR